MNISKVNLNCDSVPSQYLLYAELGKLRQQQSVVRSQKAVSAYFTIEQILPLSLAEHNCIHDIYMIHM